jgi:hypothetical protein
MKMSLFLPTKKMRRAKKIGQLNYLIHPVLMRAFMMIASQSLRGILTPGTNTRFERGSRSNETANREAELINSA